MNDKQSTGSAVASLILGALGLIAWVIPLFGLPITIVGLVQGIKGLNTVGRGMATAGVVLCILGLLGSICNAAIGAYQGATGQHALINSIRR